MKTFNSKNKKLNKNLNRTSDLSNKTDNKLIAMVRLHNNSEAFQELCRRYQDVFFRICHKYDCILSNSGLSPRDIYEEKNTIIFYCIKTFKRSKKTKFSSYLGNYARYLCLNSINARKWLLPTPPDKESLVKYDDIKSIQEYTSASFNPEDYQYVSNILSQFKDKRIKDIINLRYFTDSKTMSWKDVSKKMGLSSQTIINLERKALGLLKRKLTSKNINDIV